MQFVALYADTDRLDLAVMLHGDYGTAIGFNYPNRRAAPFDAAEGVRRMGIHDAPGANREMRPLQQCGSDG